MVIKIVKPVDEAVKQFNDQSEAKAEQRAKALEFSEDALAILVDGYEERLKYIPDFGWWVQWDGAAWKRDRTVDIFRMSRKTCRVFTSGGCHEQSRCGHRAPRTV